MKYHKKDPTDAYFSQVLHDHSEQPSEKVWERIGQQQAARGRGGFPYMRAAAVAILLALGGAMHWSGPSGEMEALKPAAQPLLNTDADLHDRISAQAGQNTSVAPQAQPEKAQSKAAESAAPRRSKTAPALPTADEEVLVASEEEALPEIPALRSPRPEGRHYVMRLELPPKKEAEEGAGEAVTWNGEGIWSLAQRKTEDLLVSETPEWARRWSLITKNQSKL